MAPQLTKFFSETQRRFHNQGKAEGKAESLLLVLSQRGLVPTGNNSVESLRAPMLLHWIAG
jgi:hypothetical protein